MDSYRVSVKVRNANLLRAIEEAGHSPGNKFAAAAGVCYTKLNDLINMKRAPVDGEGELRPDVEKLCVFLRKMPCELFDEEQMYAQVENNSTEFDVDTDTMRDLIAGVGNPELLEAMDEALDTITSDMRRVLDLRFGLEGPEHTLEQAAEIISKELGCRYTKERVRVIEANALRRLRHPSRAKLLRNFLRGED
jgi:hypothetical protein